MPHKTCATVAADVYVFALVCVMNSVVVPWLVVALLARRLEAAATSTQPLSARPPSMSALARRRFSLSDSALLGNAEGPLSTVRGVRTRRSTRSAVPPLTMHAAVCSALVPRRLSRSDSALFDNATSTVHERGVRTSPSTPTIRPLMPVRTSPVFARMLANTREVPATPRRAAVRRAV